jgi:hypothetical protein
MTLVDKDMNNLLKKQIVYTNILSYLCDKEIKREYHDNGELKVMTYTNDDNKQHRLDGPAEVDYNNGKVKVIYYYLNGESYSELEYKTKLREIKIDDICR